MVKSVGSVGKGGAVVKYRLGRSRAGGEGRCVAEAGNWGLRNWVM